MASWGNGVKRVYCTSSQGRNLSSIYTATPVAHLQHLKYDILVLRLTVGVLEAEERKIISYVYETCQTELHLCMCIVLDRQEGSGFVQLILINYFFYIEILLSI